jgi:hypothetical protein
VALSKEELIELVRRPEKTSMAQRRSEWSAPLRPDCWGRRRKPCECQLRIAAHHRNTCGAPRLSLPPPTAAALPRSCAGPVNRSRWCEPGRRGSWRRASKGCCATRSRKRGEAVIESGKPCGRDRAVSLRQRLERRVEVRAQTEPGSDVAKLDDFGTHR